MAQSFADFVRQQKASQTSPAPQSGFANFVRSGNTVTPPPPPPPAPEQKDHKPKSVTGFLGNVFKSGGRLIRDTGSGIINPIIHPKRTLENLFDPVAGLVAKGIGKGDDPRFADLTAKTDAVGKFYNDRYGGKQQILNTLYNDPVGVLSDASAVLGGVSGISKVGGLERVAAVTGKASAITNPFNIAGKTVSTVSKPFSQALESSAVKQYSQALAPTTQENKFLTNQVVPGLLQKDVKALSLKGLQNKATTNIERVGQKLETAETAIPPQTQVKTQGVLKALDDYEQGFYVNEKGKKIAIEPDKIAATQDLKSIVQEFGDQISFGSLQKVKRVWADTIAEAKGYIGRTFKEGSSLKVKDIATDAIREELAKDFPDLDKINKEYSFWKKVDKVVGDTLKRKTGQGEGLTGTIMQGAGYGGGFISGGIKAAVLFGEGAKAATKLFQSTAWRTISATSKYKLAQFLYAGNTAEASQLINKLLNTTAILGRQKSNQKEKR